MGAKHPLHVASLTRRSLVLGAAGIAVAPNVPAALQVKAAAGPVAMLTESPHCAGHSRPLSPKTMKRIDRAMRLYDLRG